MNTKPKFIFAIAALFMFCLMSFTNSFAQDDTKQASPNYKIYLDTIVAANNNSGGNKKLSAPLSNALKDVKSDAFSNYYLFSNSYERIGVSGQITHNSIYESIGQRKVENYAVYSNWALGKLREFSDEKSRSVVQFDNFTFSARVPSPTATVVNYEEIRLYVSNFNVLQNVPTVIGSLSVPKSDEMLYFVLTARPAE